MWHKFFNIFTKANITALDPDPYRIFHFTSSKISLEFFKDKEYRSVYEIVFSAFFTGNSLICREKNFYRCGSNSSDCIDENLICDKFPHCPNDIDEKSCEETNGKI